MDKYEYRMKTEQMLVHIEAKAYKQAMEIADTIDWRRVKNIVMLCATSEVYEMNGNYEKSRDILFIAYDRAPDNKKIIYRLGVLALKQGDVSEAMDCYDEFITVAPKDPNQYIMKYKILKLQNASLLLQIEALKSFKQAEYIEKWAFELARLYDEAGMRKECIQECDDLILWFNESDFVKEALELKLKYAELTPAQEVVYQQYMPVKIVEPVMPDFSGMQPLVAEPVIKEEVPVVEEVAENDVPAEEGLAATKIINAEELQQINDAMKQDLMQTVAIDSKAVADAADKIQAEKDVATESKGGPQIVVRGTPIVPEVAMGVAAVAAATDVVEELIPEVPLKSRTSEVTPETTGQLRIDEIFASWKDKQKEMEEAIAEKKALGEEKLAQEAKDREAEKLIIQEAEKIQEVPEDIRQMMEAIEGGIDLSTQSFANPVVDAEEAVVAEEPEEQLESEELVENKAEVLEEELYIEEEFHDNVFDAEEELEEMEREEQAAIEEELEDAVSSVQAELDDIEALLSAGDEQVAQTEVQEDDFEELDFLGEEVKPMSRLDAAKAVATGKTAKLPTEDIVRALSNGGVSQDTGFIVQGRYDLEAQSQVGLRAGLTEEQKKMFSYFVPVRGMSEQLVEVLERDKKCADRSGTSSTGNLLVVGRKGSGKTVLAVDVVKAIQKNRSNSSGKVAIVTGEALNKKKISDIISKLYGGALIIEKASKMNEKTITRLNKAMERETGEILVVLEDERKPLDSLLATNLEFRRRFTSRLEVPVFINDELVTFGQSYAKENGFKIDEMGILALYSKIDRNQRDDYAVSVADVKEMLDDAMDDAQRGGVKKLAQKIFKKGDDGSGRITLTEKNFNL